MHVPTETNSPDLLSRGSTTNKLKRSIWQLGPEWLTTQHYPEQTHIHVATNELVVEINPVNPVPPILDLKRISSYTHSLTHSLQRLLADVALCRHYEKPPSITTLSNIPPTSWIIYL